MGLTTPALLLISGIYYLIAGILSFFSIFGVYVLIRYGKSALLSFSVSVLYSFIFLSILASSYQNLQRLAQ